MNLDICKKCQMRPDAFMKLKVKSGYMFIGNNSIRNPDYENCRIFVPSTSEFISFKEVDKIISVGENKECPYKFEQEVLIGN